MATDRLKLYRRAAGHIGERKPASLTEGSELRRSLDDEFDEAVQYCLEQGLWNFAIRSSQFVSSASSETSFGYGFSFEMPADWIRTVVISSDPYFNQPLLRYVEETRNWYADIDTIYSRYISNHTDFGLNLAIWPATFAEYVACHLAGRVAYRITQSKETEEKVKREEKRLRIDARSKDAMNDPPGIMPVGTWARSRQRGPWGYSGERG